MGELTISDKHASPNRPEGLDGPPGLEDTDEWFLHDMPQLLERCRADARRMFGGDRLLERWVGEVREVRADTFVADWVTTIAGQDDERAEFPIDETVGKENRERLVRGAIIIWCVGPQRRARMARTDVPHRGNTRLGPAVWP